jgi:ATP-dependent helicase HrpB
MPPHEPLPIDAALPALVAALRGATAAVLRAPTGAGKTTRVPPALLTVLVDGERGVRRWRLDRLRAELAPLGLAWE